MNANRRQQAPVDLTTLSNEQRKAVEDLRGFGWQIAFVRKPLFHPPLAFVTHQKQDKMMVLQPDGSYEEITGVAFRKEDYVPDHPPKPDPINTTALDQAGLQHDSLHDFPSAPQAESKPKSTADKLQTILGLGGDMAVIRPSQEGQHHSGRHPK